MGDMRHRVSTALMQWHLIESALHDRGPWFMGVAGVRVPATVEITDTEVTFRATIPPLCHLDDSEKTVSIWCRDELLRVRPLAGDLPEHGADLLLTVSTDESVSA